MPQLVSGAGRVGGRAAGSLPTDAHDSGTRSRIDPADGIERRDVEAARSHRRPADRGRLARARSRTAGTDPASR